MREMGDKLGMTNEDIQRSLTQSNTMTEQAFNGIFRSYDSLRAEVTFLNINIYTVLFINVIEL